MSAHPNRGAATAASNPEPEEIIMARKRLMLTQTEAARTIHSSLRAWQQWEAGDRRMHAGLWELFLLKNDGYPVATTF